MRSKILIVEDYSDWRELLSGIIMREGYHVDVAETLAEARVYINKTKNLDLVILDIRLVETNEKNQDGMALLEEIRKKKFFTKVIMISGHGTMEIQRKAFRDFHAFDFFRKEQFNSEEFKKSFKEAVEQVTRERQVLKDREYIQDKKFALWKRDNPESED